MICVCLQQLWWRSLKLLYRVDYHPPFRVRRPEKCFFKRILIVCRLHDLNSQRPKNIRIRFKRAQAGPFLVLREVFLDRRKQTELPTCWRDLLWRTAVANSQNKTVVVENSRHQIMHNVTNDDDEVLDNDIRWKVITQRLRQHDSQDLEVKLEGNYLHTHLIYIPTYLSTYLTTYMRTYLSTYLHTYLNTYLPIYIPTYLSIYLLTYLYTYLHIYIPFYIPTYRALNFMQNMFCQFSCTFVFVFV